MSTSESLQEHFRQLCLCLPRWLFDGDGPGHGAMSRCGLFFVIKLILIKILFGKALRLSIWSHVSHEIVVYVRTCVYVLKC